ncbi:ferredoxin, 2Fe-2S [Variovorax sp. HW608]|uniref:2Fe-2S iron-sulfur cluster-binding protein n=1 Tax=Variovorax sp. HW608 TaxID=1034889 RepID=UPI00081FE09F|nr:2Fe-2S iron-sulfur cluster-binding protein [Variovorax sp. HW608]SCK42823.1 ferredoxin, 2Fe-2S [Variovorax sp. HW608]
MTAVTFVQATGERQTVQGLENESVMQVARRHGVPGIVADCGGELSCATCHVMVDEQWLAALPARSAVEEEMLDCTAEMPTVCSRLACQVRLTPALEGLVVHVPRSQK